MHGVDQHPHHIGPVRELGEIRPGTLAMKLGHLDSGTLLLSLPKELHHLTIKSKKDLNFNIILNVYFRAVPCTKGLLMCGLMDFCSQSNLYIHEVHLST